MGHKVHPIGFRIGVIRDWQAKWYADKHYAEFLKEDMKLREGIQNRYSEAAVSLIEIERQANKVSITIHTSRPGIVIGRGGQRVDETRTALEKLVGKKVQLNIQEIQRPELDAYLVAKNIADQIERRIAFRRAMKQTTVRVLQAGAKGIRVSASGRLGGAEIARRLTMHEGQVPLHTLRADIDYGFVEAKTVMGRIGIKVWIYKGDILPELKTEETEEGTAETTPEAVLTAPVEAEAAGVSTAEEAPKPAVRRRAVAQPAATDEAGAGATTETDEKAKAPARRRTVTSAATPVEDTETKAPVRRRTVRTTAPEKQATEEAEEKQVKAPARRRTKPASSEEAKEEN